MSCKLPIVLLLSWTIFPLPFIFARVPFFLQETKKDNQKRENNKKTKRANKKEKTKKRENNKEKTKTL